MASGDFDPNDETVNEAMQSVFDRQDGGATLSWHGTEILLGFKYDLSVMARDSLDMVASVDERCSSCT